VEAVVMFSFLALLSICVSLNQLNTQYCPTSMSRVATVFVCAKRRVIWCYQLVIDGCDVIPSSDCRGNRNAEFQQVTTPGRPPPRCALVTRPEVSPKQPLPQGNPKGLDSTLAERFLRRIER